MRWHPATEHHPFVADSPCSFIVARRTHIPLPLVEAPVAALASLDQAAKQRDPFFGSESLASPIFDPLRGLPEFATLIDDVGLDVAVLAGG